ncbi:protein of unknown function [Cupriavidus taiwanensis]|uniref:Uncharacterized protein n=1 Tax=Cupriavidus taiwanensis TaxID=164546 RepID=A0A9Q7UTW2_9BURK|nr:protein of unknown function [Cupriavidus taiwanensis]
MLELARPRSLAPTECGSHADDNGPPPSGR